MLKVNLVHFPSFHCHLISFQPLLVIFDTFQLFLEKFNDVSYNNMSFLSSD